VLNNTCNSQVTRSHSHHPGFSCGSSSKVPRIDYVYYSCGAVSLLRKRESLNRGRFSGLYGNCVYDRFHQWNLMWASTFQCLWPSLTCGLSYLLKVSQLTPSPLFVGSLRMFVRYIHSYKTKQNTRPLVSHYSIWGLCTTHNSFRLITSCLKYIITTD
jgi:hypothetical protein